MSTRTVTFEVRVDTSRAPDREIGEEVRYALGYLLLAEGRLPLNAWVEVPYSLSGYHNKGPTHIRVSHETGE